MEKGLTKKDSALIYGIAIFFMVYHHLFAKIPENYIYLCGSSVTQKIAWAGRLCITLFAFISGYGICKNFFDKQKIDIHTKPTGKQIGSAYVTCAKRALKFYQRYWSVFVIYISLGLLLHKLSLGSVSRFVLSVLGLDNSYNYEWWYVSEYLLMLLLFPLIDYFIRLCTYFISSIAEKIPGKKWTLRVLGIVIVLVLGIFRNASIFSFFLKQFDNGRFVCVLVFIEGYACAAFHLFEIGKNRKKWIQILISMIMLVGLFSLRIYRAYDNVYCKYDAFITTPIIYAMVVLVNSGRYVLPFVGNLIRKLGPYSVYIWLIHTFFCKYYFNEQIASLRYSTVIFIVTFAVSLVAAMLQKKINDIIDKLKNKEILE